VRFCPLTSPKLAQFRFTGVRPKTGLFSAVVSAFIIETYKTLLPDNSGATVALLTQLVAQSQSNVPSTSSSAVLPAQGSFKPSEMSIRINILMFLSLFLSLTCALMSTLIQQWAREYLQYSQLSAPPQKRARVRAYLFQGLTKFQMRRMVESIPVFLHISVFLFFFAVSEFLHTVNGEVGLAARISVSVLLLAYLILSVLPLVVSSSPYQTALTTPLRPCVIILRFVFFRLPMLAMKGSPPISFRSVIHATLQHKRSRDLLADTERRAASLDHLALQWLLKGVDEDNMDKFVTGLPALIHSPFITDATATMEALVTDGILESVGDHLTTCMSSRELSQTVSITRAMASVEALDAIFSVLDQRADTPQYRRATSILIKSSDVFRMSQDSAFALRAACIRALTFRKLISGSLCAPGSAHPSPLPPRLSPLALRLQMWITTDSRRWRNQAELEEAEMYMASDGYDAWCNVVNDGHLVNFLVLVRDVLSYVERPSLDLTTVWETLETMVGTFTITQPTPSASASSRFEEVHTDARECLYGSNQQGLHEGPDHVSMVHISSGIDIPDILSMGGPHSVPMLRVSNETSSRRDTKVQERLPVYAAERYSQLLELVDKVATGLRLVTVLSARTAKSANPTEQPSSAGVLRFRHDQIYAKDPFGAFDVVDEFLSALPDYISSVGPENARKMVETILAEDGLLRGIDEHLKTSVNSQVPRGQRRRMSMTCLNVLEKIFSFLEGSLTVRWYDVGADAVLRSVKGIMFNQNAAGRPSAIYAYCAFSLANHVIISQFRARATRGHLPVVHNLEEQLFILKVHDLMLLGDGSERKQRQARRQGDPDTEREASSPQYLRNLLLTGPLQNFSMMAFYLVPHLERGETVPEIVWTILNKLMEVQGLADTTDSFALEYFEMVRARAQKEVVEKEGAETEEQLELLGMLNTVAEWLHLPELSMPELVIPPPSDSEAPIPPNRDAYAPIYI
jgi:Family of unknown function (DUF6535)